ncbi:MAG TPA: rhomboid family intramembrane serine protease [Silvibacterium sp.]|jgi:rhomboid protease GluP|nr:rhomboid family intramembrane serine protease [Silvibacterium sp.]
MDRSWQNGGAYRRQNGASDTGFHSGSVRPEILPPEESTQGGWYPPPDQYQTQPPPAPADRPQKRATWAAAPATYLLMAINGIVFLGMVLNGVSFLSPTVRQLVNWGANNGTLVLQYGQWWRLITAMFVHVGIIHIATNMWCLWNLGLLAEPLMGPMGVFAAYIFTGFAGNLLSVAVHPGVPGGPQSIVGAGASGAVFGLAGVLIVLLKSPLLPVPKPELKRLRWSVIQFALLNFAIGLYTVFGPSPVQIDNMAHLGGFLSGLALGVPLVPRIGAQRETFLRRRRLALGGMAFALALLSYGLRSYWLAAAK